MMSEERTCHDCRLPAAPGRSLCSRHQATHWLNELRRRQARAKAGLCVRCAEPAERWGHCSPKAGQFKRHCSECLAIRKLKYAAGEP